MKEFRIIPTKFLMTQIQCLDKKTKRIIHQKKELLKINPFRYKNIHSKQYNHVFRIKFTDCGEEKRLVYVVLKNIVFLCFVLDRSKKYKDLEKYFKKVKEEMRV
jgi:hypothetical protein